MHTIKGQTLFELLVSLLIAAMLAMMAVSGWDSLLRKEKARVAINRLVVATQETRHLALAMRKTVTICPTLKGTDCDGKWSDILMVFAGSPGDATKSALNTYAALSDGQVVWRSFRQDNFLQMQQNGLTLAQNGTFIYCPENNDARYARALIINKSGRGRIAEDLDGDGIVDLDPGKPVRCPA